MTMQHCWSEFVNKLPWRLEHWPMGYHVNAQRGLLNWAHLIDLSVRSHLWNFPKSLSLLTLITSGYIKFLDGGTARLFCHISIYTYVRMFFCCSFFYYQKHCLQQLCTSSTFNIHRAQAHLVRSHWMEVGVVYLMHMGVKKKVYWEARPEKWTTPLIP